MACHIFTGCIAVPINNILEDDLVVTLAAFPQKAAQMNIDGAKFSLTQIAKNRAKEIC